MTSVIIGGGPKYGPGPISTTPLCSPTRLNFNSSRVEAKTSVTIAFTPMVAMGSDLRWSRSLTLSDSKCVTNTPSAVVLSSGNRVTTAKDDGNIKSFAAADVRIVVVEPNTPIARSSGTVRKHDGEEGEEGETDAENKHCDDNGDCEDGEDGGVARPWINITPCTTPSLISHSSCCFGSMFWLLVLCRGAPNVEAIMVVADKIKSLKPKAAFSSQLGGGVVSTSLNGALGTVRHNRSEPGP